MATVYNFKIYDIIKDKYVVQPMKSTLERIELVGGQAILETAEDVSDADILEGKYITPKNAL